MTNAQGSQTETLIWVENIWGASPVGVSANVIDVIENSLEFTKSTLKNDRLGMNRQPSAVRTGLGKVNGSLKFNLCYGDYDNIIASALQGVWTANTCASAATPEYLGIQKGFTDVGIYNKYVGLAVDEFSIEIKPDSLIPVDVKFVGKTMTANTTSANNTPTAITGNEPFDSFTGSITVGNTAIATITDLKVNVKNGMNASTAVMSNTAIALTSQTLDVEGSLGCYLQDMTLTNSWLNETVSNISVTMSRQGKSLTMTIPALKFTTGDAPAKEGDVIQNLNFSAHYDSTSNTTIKFVR